MNEQERKEAISRAREMFEDGLTPEEVAKALDLPISAAVRIQLLMEMEEEEGGKTEPEDEMYPFLKAYSATQQSGPSGEGALRAYEEEMAKDERVYAQGSQALQEQMYAQLRMWRSIAGEPTARIVTRKRDEDEETSQ